MSYSSLAKDNFWNRKRVEANFRIRDIAELLGGSESKWGMYFSGQIMPPTIAVTKLCDLFEVDFNEGFDAFRETHESWKATGGTRTLITGESDRKKSKQKVTRTVKKYEVKKSEDVAERSGVAVDKVLAILYDILSFEEFNAVEARLRAGKDFRDLIFRKVDYETYSRVCLICNVEA